MVGRGGGGCHLSMVDVIVDVLLGSEHEVVGEGEED